MISKRKRTKIDLSGNHMTDSLVGMLGARLRKKKKTPKKTRLSGLRGPWKHDFKNFCVKCNSTFHLQRHHITYQPELTAFLCEDCHKRITGLNARGSHVAGGNKKTKTKYTNVIRVILYRWFLANPWPKDPAGDPVHRLSKTLVRGILKDADFKKKIQSLGINKSNAGEQLDPTRSNTGSSSVKPSGRVGGKLSARREAPSAGAKETNCTKLKGD